MMRKFWFGFVTPLVVTAFAAGCSAGSGASGDDDDDGGTGNSFHFETGGFTVPAGSEAYHCFFRDVETGATGSQAVGAVRFAYTPGSLALHHIVIFSAGTSEGDTDRECDLLENDWNPRYAGGTSTDPLQMPSGVAMPVGAVEHVVIQFHYTNADVVDVVDHTAVDIDFTQPGDAFTPAALFVSGQTGFTIPASTLGYDVVGECDLPSPVPDVNLFAVWPHMHQNGVWFKIEATRQSTTTTLWDQAWNFGDQPLRVLDEPLTIGGGDNLHTVCTYDNPSDNPIGYGESSFQEMCFDFFFYYPALTAQTLPCITN